MRKALSDINAARVAYQSTEKLINTGMFLSRTSALSEADLAAAKQVIQGLAVVKSLWNGNADEAVSGIDSHIDFKDGNGRYHETFRPGPGTYEPESTDVSFKSKAGQVSDISAYNSYNTRDLLVKLCGEPQQPEWLKNFNAKLRELDADFTQEQTELEMAASNIVPGDYLGSGHAGPYAGGEFAGDDGLEYIETVEGMLVRIGVGYSAIDGDDWDLYSSDMFDSFIQVITESPSEAEGSILLGGDSSGNHGQDVARAESELSLVIEYAMLLYNPEMTPSDAFMSAIYNADKAYREEQGQTNLFQTQE